MEGLLRRYDAKREAEGKTHQVHVFEGQTVFVKGTVNESFAKNEISIYQALRQLLDTAVRVSCFLSPLYMGSSPAGYQVLVLPYYGKELTEAHFGYANVVSRVWEILAVLHGCGISHGDPKPDAFRYKQG